MEQDKINRPENKYISLNHRRRVTAAPKTENNSSTQTPSNPSPKKENLSFTAHAQLRQTQRDISSAAVIQTVNQGEKLPSQQSDIHLDEKTQVVLGKNGKVITVQENKRNTKYDLLTVSQQRVNTLLAKIASNNNNDYAMCELAELYLSGELGTREVQKAYPLLEQAATARKNSHAMCLIARLYEEGDLGAVDMKKAQEWLEKAAKRNNRYALAILGQRTLAEYLKIPVSEKEVGKTKALLQKAIGYLKRSAAMGSTRAMWQLAKIEEEGWLGEKNLPQAIEQYAKAAKLGSPSSLEDLYRLVLAKQVDPEVFEPILDQASKLIAKTSSELAVQIGLAQIKGELGANPQRGFAMLEQAAKKNNKEALIALAKCYKNGLGCEANPKLSLYWYQQLKVLYEKASQLGNVSAQLALGDLFLKGALGAIDFKSAEEWFISAANTGDVYASYYLGRLYHEGRLGDHEPAKGIPWITYAIEKWTEQAFDDNSDAAENLIQIYLDKHLGFKDYAKAAFWLALLTQNANMIAFKKLLSLYCKGKLKLDKAQKAHIFSPTLIALIKDKAINEEHPHALWLLAQFTQEGFLLEEQANPLPPWSQKLEMVLTQQAPTLAPAALLLGRLYLQANGPLTYNLQQATKWICWASCLFPVSLTAIEELKAITHSTEWKEHERKQIVSGLLECAEQLELKAPYRIGRILGDVYRKGHLTEPNYPEAAKWYARAVDLDNSKAMYQLGAMYQTGLLGNIDLKEAIRLYQLAAKQKHPKAFNALIKLGEYTETSPLETRSHKTEVVKPPKTPAVFYSLGKQYQADNNGKTKDPVQAAFWFHKAAKRHHAESAYELAQLYVSGQLGAKVRPVAIHFFKQAAKSHHLASINELIKIYSIDELTTPNAEQVMKWQARAVSVLKR